MQTLDGLAARQIRTARLLVGRSYHQTYRFK